MGFKDYYEGSETKVDESAQMKLDLVTKINSLIGSADITVLRRVAKMLESGSSEE
jgi:hypothetical protein